MPLLDLFWSMLWIFLFVAWIWVVIAVISDTFRSDDLNGWGKALWTLFIILIPWLGVLVYLIARGNSMADRSAQAAADADQAARQYIQSAAGGASVADELTKLAKLKETGVLSEEEFNAQRAKVLA